MPVCAKCGKQSSTKYKASGKERWFHHPKYPNDVLCNSCVVSVIKKQEPKRHTCGYCKQDYIYDIKNHAGTKYCSEACYHDARGRAVTVHCSKCKKSIKKPRSRLTNHLNGSPLRHHFCSKACQLAFKPASRLDLTCATCGKEYRKKESYFAKQKPTRFFCSMRCRDIAQTTRITLNCANCGRDFQRKKYYVTEKQAKYYCSMACRNNDPKYIDMMREKRYTEHHPKYDNKLELYFQAKLREAGITFTTREKMFGQPDIFIAELKLAVFVDGKHYHADPRFYGPEDIIWNARTTKRGRHFEAITAKEIWSRDAAITKTLQSRGYTVLRFWESDIRRDILGCINKIKEVMVAQ